MFDLTSWAALFKNIGTFLTGLVNSLEMAAMGFVLAFFLGVIFGLFGTGNSKFLRAINRIYVEFFQNTPLMLQATFFFYAIRFSPLPNIPAVFVGGISLGIYHGAYFSEVIRSGIQSVPLGQSEASYSQGFTYVQTMLHIVIPQSIKVILPPMVTQIVNLIKNTSCLLLVVGTVDLISRTQAYTVGEITGTHNAVVAYVFCAALFFVICYPLSKLASRWEEKLKSRDAMYADAPKKKAPDAVTDAELDAIIESGEIENLDLEELIAEKSHGGDDNG